MLMALHKQARTTPHVRAQIATSDEPVAVLARRYGVSSRGAMLRIYFMQPWYPLSDPGMEDALYEIE